MLVFDEPVTTLALLLHTRSYQWAPDLCECQPRINPHLGDAFEEYGVLLQSNTAPTRDEHTLPISNCQILASRAAATDTAFSDACNERPRPWPRTKSLVASNILRVDQSFPLSRGCDSPSACFEHALRGGFDLSHWRKVKRKSSWRCQTLPRIAFSPNSKRGNQAHSSPFSRSCHC